MSALNVNKRHPFDHTVYPVKTRMETSVMNGKKTLGAMLIERNNLLINLFRDLPGKVELFGKAESPMVVIDRQVKLSGYVHNYKFYFLGSWADSSDVVKQIKLNYANKITPKFMLEYVTKYQHERWEEVTKRMFANLYAGEDNNYKKT